MRCIVDDLSDAIFGKPRKRSSPGASAPWVKIASDAPEAIRLGRRHACGVVTKVTRGVAIVAWKDGGRSGVPIRYLRRATAADVARNPHGTPTAQDPAGFDKRKLWQAIERERKKEARAKVRTLREAHKQARETRKAAIGSSKAECKAARAAARARVAELRERAKRAALEAKVAARTTCDVGAKLAGTARGEVTRTAAELHTERAYQRSLRVLERGERERKRAEKRATAAERRSESDDEVRANIPAELRPTFEKVKRQIKGSARKSRTEAFLEWIEEHPAEEYAAIDDATDRAVAEMERRQWQQ